MIFDEYGEPDAGKVVKALLVFLSVVVGIYLLWHVFTSWMPFLFPLFFATLTPWMIGKAVFHVVEDMRLERGRRQAAGLNHYSNEEIGDMVSLGGLLAIFLFLYGIPQLFMGMAFDVFATPWVWRKYYAFLDWLLSFVNEAIFLDLRATPEGLKLLWPDFMQIFAWAFFVMIAPFSYWWCVEMRNDAQKLAREEEERQKREEEKEATMAEWREREERRRMIEEKNRRAREEREREIIERKEKEAEAPDPWDSGFL